MKHNFKKLIKTNITKSIVFALIILVSTQVQAVEKPAKKQNAAEQKNIKLYSKPTIKDLDEIAVKYDIMKLNYDLKNDGLKQDYAPSKKTTENDSSSICRAVKLVIDKSDRELKLYYANEWQKTYKIKLGFNPVGKKIKRNDGKTPEGLYHVSYKNSKSQYYKAFAVSYPNAEDKARAAALGVDPGGDIMIHGLENKSGFAGKVKHWIKDWTAGCIALTDAEMDELWKVVSEGALIDIRP